MSKLIIILLCVLGVVIIGGGLVWVLLPEPVEMDPGPGDTVCTQEAKLCPDGSSVGRTGLNCEFAECPEWKTYVNKTDGYEIKYPSDWQFNIADSSGFAHVELKKEDNTQDKVLIMGADDSYENAYYTIRIDAGLESYLSGGDYKIVTVGGLNGLQEQVGAAPSSGPDTITEVNNNGKFYIISYGAYAHQETHEKFMNIYDTILSTFKFINN
jgi:hypothetical protein